MNNERQWLKSKCRSFCRYLTVCNAVPVSSPRGEKGHIEISMFCTSILHARTGTREPMARCLTCSSSYSSSNVDNAFPVRAMRSVAFRRSTRPDRVVCHACRDSCIFLFESDVSHGLACFRHHTISQVLTTHCTRTTCRLLKEEDANGDSLVHDAVFRQAEKDWHAFVDKLTERLIGIDETVPELPVKDVVRDRVGRRRRKKQLC